jgi:hypothetical protein
MFTWLLAGLWIRALSLALGVWGLLTLGVLRVVASVVARVLGALLLMFRSM